MVRDSASGAIEYMGPQWDDVPELMSSLTAWANGEQARALAGPIRAAIIAYRFVTIHPFMDGNGRTTRALATFELWRSGYSFRGYLTMEDYYARDLVKYYASLQMGHHHNYYFGRHDPDLTPWLAYFIGVLREAALEVRRLTSDIRGVPTNVNSVREGTGKGQPRTRRQESLMMRCLVKVLATPGLAPTFTPAEVSEWYGVSVRTAREWLTEWAADGFVVAAAGTERTRQWSLTPELSELLSGAAKSNSGTT